MDILHYFNIKVSLKVSKTGVFSPKQNVQYPLTTLKRPLKVAQLYVQSSVVEPVLLFCLSEWPLNN